MVQWLGVHHTMQGDDLGSIPGWGTQSACPVSSWAPVPQLMRPYATTGICASQWGCLTAAETQHSQLNKYILKILMVRHQICKKIIRIIITNFYVNENLQRTWQHSLNLSVFFETQSHKYHRIHYNAKCCLHFCNFRKRRNSFFPFPFW